MSAKPPRIPVELTTEQVMNAYHESQRHDSPEARTIMYLCESHELLRERLQAIERMLPTAAYPLDSFDVTGPLARKTRMFLSGPRKMALFSGGTMRRS